MHHNAEGRRVWVSKQGLGLRPLDCLPCVLPTKLFLRFYGVVGGGLPLVGVSWWCGVVSYLGS